TYSNLSLRRRYHPFESLGRSARYAWLMFQYRWRSGASGGQLYCSCFGSNHHVLQLLSVRISIDCYRFKHEGNAQRTSTIFGKNAKGFQTRHHRSASDPSRCSYATFLYRLWCDTYLNPGLERTPWDPK